MPNVKEIMRDWLEDKNYDGLVHASTLCSCRLDKLFNQEDCDGKCMPAIEGKNGELAKAIKEE